MNERDLEILDEVVICLQYEGGPMILGHIAHRVEVTCKVLFHLMQQDTLSRFGWVAHDDLSRIRIYLLGCNLRKRD